MYDDSKSAQRRAEIDAAIRDLPIFPEEEWQVRHFVDELCLRADIIAASKGHGRAPPHFRPATRQMTMNELRQLRRRFFDLARKVERGVKTKRARERLKRAREQLTRLIEGLHAPTIEALNGAPALMVGGRPRLAAIRHIENGLLKKPLEDSDLSALELRYWSAVARAAEINANESRAVAYEPESGTPLADMLATLPDLRRRLQPEGPRYAEHVGRPPDRQLRAVANLVIKAYVDLTGREPTFSQGKPGGDERDVHGPFIDFARTIFAIMGIGHDALSYVSVAARARRGRGRKQ